MRQCPHLPAGARLSCYVERAGPAFFGSREQIAGEAIRKRGLADALLSAQQPAVMQAAAFERLQQRTFGFLMAIETLGEAGMREALEAVRFRQLLDLLHGGRAGHR